MIALFPCYLVYILIHEHLAAFYYICALSMIVPCIIGVYLFWPLSFGKVTLTENYVKWHGIFMRSIKIPYSELRYVEIRRIDEKHDVPDLYGNGHMYLLLSSKPLPQKPVEKIRSGDGLIKYQFLMRDAAVFSEYLPEGTNPCFSRVQKPTHVRRRSGRATGRNGKPSAKRHAKSAGKSGRLKNTKSIDRSGRCSSTARALSVPAGYAGACFFERGRCCTGCCWPRRSWDWRRRCCLRAARACLPTSSARKTRACTTRTSPCGAFSGFSARPRSRA